MERYKAKKDFLAEAEMLDHRISVLQHLVHQRDLNSMITVLQNLEFLDGEIITLRGRIAATITAGDELVITQLLLSGVLEDLTPQDCAALFAAFVSEDQGKDVGSIPNALEVAWEKLMSIAHNVATISRDCGCDVDVEKFQRKFNPVFADLTLAWASGASFAKLMETNSGFYEGSIILTMKRLDELLNQVSKAARVAGSDTLGQKFAQAAKSIERGIVFTASLYL